MPSIPKGNTTDASIAVLDSRTRGLETAMNKMESDFARLETSVAAGFNTLSEKLNVRDRTPWATIFTALGVLLAFLTAIGTLAYWPVKTELENAKVAISALDRGKIDREYAITMQRIQDREYTRLERQIEKLEAEVYWRRGYRPEPKLRVPPLKEPEP